MTEPAPDHIPSAVSPPPKRAKTATSPTATDAPVLGPELTGPVPLRIKRLSDVARLPTRGSAFSVGYDLYAARAATVPARGRVLVDTDLSIALPAGTYGRVAPRSGLAVKHFVDTGAGVIDPDYRGPLRVLLFNHADADFQVAHGDRIAQLIIERVYTPEVVEVHELDDTVRGVGGFGSTG